VHKCAETAATDHKSDADRVELVGNNGGRCSGYHADADVPGD
jgi:hypothetical protein